MSKDKDTVKDTSLEKNHEEEINLGQNANDPETEMQEEELSETELLREELGKEKDRYLRLYAEFDNFRRRTARENIELRSTASKSVMEAILPILDDFDRALAEMKKSDKEGHFEGINMIINKLKESLRKEGLEEMPVKEGDKFDADLHEAVTQIPAPHKKLKGKIVDVIQKGYTLGDKIIRYPKVVTGA